MSKHKPGRRLAAGQLIAARDLVSVDGAAVAIPDPDRLVHLQFRRFAGCPVCNLHLRSIVRRHDEITSAGVREVAVFHTDEQELSEYTTDLPFAVIADPGKRLYAEFGVESAARALLDPRAWGAIARGVLGDLGPILRGRRRAPALRPQGGRLGLPADFLIAPDGRVLAAKYGEHANDQWSVDELLHLVAAVDVDAMGLT